MSRPDRNLPLFQALGQTFNEFSDCTSLHGFRFIMVRPDRPLLERCLWWIIQILAICGAVYVITFTWREFMSEPTVITLENLTYPISNIPFPGISICNVNKISLERATNYAKYLSQKSKVKQEKLLELLEAFGEMHETESFAIDEDLEFFQQILNDYDVDNETGSFNSYKTLRKLAVPCEEFISNCFWNSKAYNCMHLFVFESTMEGFCCIFNYASPLSTHRTSAIILKSNTSQLFPQGYGINNGLTLRVKSNVSDYFYPSFSFVGTNVHIFNPNDFPDETSGNFQEKVVETGVEMHIRLYSVATYAVPEVKHYPLAKRKCKFSEEARTLIGTKYSYSDCILDCRLQSMISLCQCVPFLFIKSIMGPLPAQCTVIDTPCLSRFKDKWGRLYPHDFEGEDELDREKQDSLICQNCLPTCSGTLYNVKNDFTYLRNGPSGYSVINIFFDSPYATIYKHDVIYYWFEIVGTFGGTCSLTLGLSIISVIELVYYFTVILLRYLF